MSYLVATPRFPGLGGDGPGRVAVAACWATVAPVAKAEPAESRARPLSLAGPAGVEARRS
jgi:hypothetical protein